MNSYIPRYVHTVCVCTWSEKHTTTHGQVKIRNSYNKSEFSKSDSNDTCFVNPGVILFDSSSVLFLKCLWVLFAFIRLQIVRYGTGHQGKARVGSVQQKSSLISVTTVPDPQANLVPPFTQNVLL